MQGMMIVFMWACGSREGPHTIPVREFDLSGTVLTVIFCVAESREHSLVWLKATTELTVAEGTLGHAVAESHPN